MKNKKSLRFDTETERQLKQRYFQGIQLGLSISAVIIAIIALIVKL